MRPNVAHQDAESSNRICRQYFYHILIHTYVEIPRIFVNYSQEKIFSMSNHRAFSLTTHKKNIPYIITEINSFFLYYDWNKKL